MAAQRVEQHLAGNRGDVVESPNGDHVAAKPGAEQTESSDGRTIVTMFAGIVLLAAAMMSLAFVIAWLVTGTPV
jgi:hypothetical protein